MAISEDVVDEEDEVSPMEEIPQADDPTPPSYPLEIERLTSFHSLMSFSTPQTLKLIGYLNNRKVIILVDNGNNHNFIHFHISRETNFYIHASKNFQNMISNGDSMKCGEHCEIVHLQICQYHLKSHMFSINIGSCEIMLSDEWLCTLDPIFMYFKDLTMQFQQEGQQYKFQGITTGLHEIISSD
jgi:hypothetical protein